MPYAANDGVRIRYEVEGRGQPLVLHVGFAGCLEDWDDAGYVADLRDRYRLIRLDPRGQGRSDKPHDPAAYTATHRVGDVLAVLDAEGIDRAHFWGYSLGGWIGFLLGATAPDRIAALVIGGASPFGGYPQPVEGDAWLDGLRRGMADLAAQWEAEYPECWLSSGERARFLAADAEALAAARVARLSESDLAEEAVAAIRTPTLLYVGTRDEPEAVERAARLMPDAAFVPLEGLDHAQALARRDLVLPYVLDFLARIEARPTTRS